MLQNSGELGSGIGQLYHQESKDGSSQRKFRIWKQGAGWNQAFSPLSKEYSTQWPSVHQPYSESKPKKVTFTAEYLADKLILLVREQVEMGRPVRSRVPPPSAIKKPMPDPFGVPSCDFLTMKEEEDSKEMKKLAELQSSCGVVVQPVEMPTATSLHGRRVQVMFLEKDAANPRAKSVLS